MKAILAATFILVGRVVGADYPLETLVDDAARHAAPARIQQAMARIEEKRLRESAEIHQFSEHTLAWYFSAVPVDLGDKKQIVYLVFPSSYSTAFFGMHAISYWLLLQGADGNFKLLFSGASDRIKILLKRSHGLFDIESFYGESVSHLRFDGNVYQRENG